MIRVATLNNSNEHGHGLALADLHARIAQLRLMEIDILCCQGVWRATDDREEDQTSLLSQSLQMNCSCFAAYRHRQSEKDRNPRGAGGLAILTGTEMWPLNSGNLKGICGPDGSREIVQFAHVRKNGASVLVLNLQLCESRHLQLLQLGALFSHQMLKGRYGAVVLCSDRRTKLTEKELQTITKMSNYVAHSPAPSASSTGEGMLWILVANKQPVASVTISNLQTGQSLEFKMDRIAPDKNNKPYYALSFDEQWAGYKTNVQTLAT